MEPDNNRPRTTIAARVAKWITGVREWDHTIGREKGPLEFVLICGERGGDELMRVMADRTRAPEEIANEVEAHVFDLAGEAIDTREGWKASLYCAAVSGHRMTGAFTVRVTAAHRESAERSALAPAAPATPSAEHHAQRLVALGFVDLQRQTRTQLADAHDEIARRDEHHRELMSANVSMAKALSDALATVVAQSQAAVASADERARKAEESARQSREDAARAREDAAKARGELDEAAKVVEESAAGVAKLKRGEMIVGNILARVLEKQGVKLSAEDIDAINGVLR